MAQKYTEDLRGAVELSLWYLPCIVVSPFAKTLYVTDFVRHFRFVHWVRARRRRCRH
jgi:hypothetical protein